MELNQCEDSQMLLNEWLTEQKEREDRVGVLARRLLADSSGPLWANDPQTFRQYLTDRSADSESFAALEQALAEWIDRGKRSPVLPAKRSGKGVGRKETR